jgi:rubrerythrin
MLININFLPNKISHIFEIDKPLLQVHLEKSTRLLGELNAMARMVPDIIKITSIIFYCKKYC